MTFPSRACVLFLLGAGLKLATPAATFQRIYTLFAVMSQFPKDTRVKVVRTSRRGNTIEISTFNATVQGETPSGKLNVNDEYGKTRFVDSRDCQHAL